MEYLDIAKRVLRMEADAIISAAERLQQDDIEKLVNIFSILKNVGGSLVFCGVGKSGLIAQKLASTFTSLGLPSFFLHPVEALHGDLGRVSKTDAIVFISKSGTTEEIMKLIPYLPVEHEMRIAMVGCGNSPIAKKCALFLDCKVNNEACINNLAPTTSSTLALAIGDAMAVVYESMIGLSQESFAVNHPGGLLGKSLRLKVSDLMLSFEQSPHVLEGATLQEIILEMTKRPAGGCAIVDRENHFMGIVVEGDIRRTFIRENLGLSTPVKQIMNKNPVRISPDKLAFEALKLMEGRERQISILPVVGEDNIFLGLIRLHDLLKEGFLANK